MQASVDRRAHSRTSSTGGRRMAGAGGKKGELARRHYDWSKDVAAISAPTLLVFGEADAVRPAHAVEFGELLGASGMAAWNA